MENENCVTVTHFINPHLFWYKTIEAPGEEFQVLAGFEQRLLELYKNRPTCDNFLRPEKGDKVAVNFIAWNKFIRAEVLEKADFQHEEYIVWALDYGFPLLTKKEYMRNLPNNLHADIGHVRVGGIANVCPAEQEYNDMEGNLVMVKKDKWLQKVCNMLEQLLADANSVSFFKHYQAENGHTWGDLFIVNHKGIQINAREYLLKTTSAVEENNFTFKKTFCTFKSIKIAPWLSNDRNTKMKINNIKHNYIEHSQQMNAALVDENAKRKVEDWQKRNERKKGEANSDIFQNSCELADVSVEDVTFDDSVSFDNDQQVNYIGKAGILTKIKQQKYSTDQDLPPPALPKFFDIDGMMTNLKLSMESKCANSLHSGSTNTSSCLEKEFHEHTKPGSTTSFNDKECDSTPCVLNGPLLDLETNSSISNFSKLRQQILLDMRKKVARAEKKKMNITKSTDCESMCYQNETNNSTINNKSKTLDNYPYQLLEQSLSTLNNTTVDNAQNKELSVRAKQLKAMRKNLCSSTFTSADCSQLNNTTESKLSTNSNISKMEKEIYFKDKCNVKYMNESNIELKPKSESNHGTSNTSSKNLMKEKIKCSQSGYDNFTMVPAGFDITRLQTYKDEKNHWHRKKSTRNDYIPHENSSSTDELLYNSSQDQSFSYSDIPLRKSIRQTSPNNKTLNNANSVQYSQLKACFQKHDSNVELKTKNVKGNKILRELSTSTNSSLLSQRSRKRRQLKSPTSQLSKIDQILHEHCVEKELGNKNILDLHLLNTSSSSQKSLLASTSSNNSFDNLNISSTAQNNCVINSSSHSSSSVDKMRNEKMYKDVLNYDTLMDVKHTETLPVVAGEHKIQTKYIDHLVLAHSSIRLTPIENISEAPFLPEIHEEMRQMRLNKVYRIQVYSWSHVSRNNSLFVVNPSRSGKTWSYLPPLCSLICCRKDTVKSSYGPVAIILVASLKHVELVNRYCRRLMNSLKNDAPSCVPSYGLRNLIETKINLLNGCGILVATPSNILRLLHENNNEPLFDSDRLQHIVIDDMDVMMSRSQQDFKNACSILFKMAKKSKFNKLSPQLIVTSRDWDGLMVKFIRKSNQPLLLIGDFLEAAVYGQATLSVKLKSNMKKNDTIIKFLKDMSKATQGIDNRTLIMCNEDEDVQNVHKCLQDCGYSCLSFYSQSTETERVTIDEWKKKVSSQIVILTDARFCELKIQNVNNLIHYSMPTSWTQFTFRFSALARTYKNYVSDFEDISSVSNKNNAYSMILLDENNNLQLPRLVDFMRKHNQVVKDEIQAVSRRVVEERIVNTTHLCPLLLEFGECDEPRCDKRHELTRFDVINKKDGVPCTGDIRLHVLKVFSPTYYSVRLLYHKPPNATKWYETRRSSEALTFSIQLNKHYSSGNIYLHWPPNVNDMCIYQNGEDFRRALILEAPTIQQKDINVVQIHLKVTLKLIDEGTIINSVKCNQIFVCDEKFKDFPPQAVDVRLMKVVPFDNERCWDSKTTKQVQKWIIDDIKLNYVVQASIDFALANTIWVKNIVVMEKLNGIGAYSQVVNLKMSLIEKNYGILYDGDRKHVRDLAEQFNLLNSSEFNIDTNDSDIDYQSCKNESINLIRFSSSNGEDTNSSMESAETGLEKIKKVEHKAIDLEGPRNETKIVGIENKMPALDEENWCDSDQQLVEVYDPFQINNLGKCEMQKEETWTNLILNELVKVEIGDEGENGNWENIFLQIIDKKSMYLFEELQKLIVVHIENLKSNEKKQQQIYDFEPLQNCIVKYNNLYLRAKIYGVYGENTQQRLYRFFLCDYACFTDAKTDELYKDFLYETTKEIVAFTPFQAVHCTLAGVKWERFNKRYQVTKDYLYACAVAVSDFQQHSASNLPNFSIKSYKILLYECEIENEFSNALLFNKALVDNGITVYDEETKHFLEYEIGTQEKKEQNSSNMINAETEENVVPETNKDEVFTPEQLIDFIKSDAFDIEWHDILKVQKKPDLKYVNNNLIESPQQQNSLDSLKNVDDINLSNTRIESEKLKVPTSDSEIDEQGHCTSYSNSSIKSSISLISTDNSNSSKSESVLPLPSLKALYKRPLTSWYQNDCMIFISIYAPDIKDYLLEVTSKTIFFVAEIQSEKLVLILHLLGSIDARSISHELKGLNVIIRLKKNVFMKWPRLLQQSTKYSWLKYNFNAFDSIEMEYIMPQQILHNILDSNLNFANQQNSNYNSDEDSERELYQTYNPIEDNDGDCDPFSAF